MGMNIVEIFSDSASEYNSSHWTGKVRIEALVRAGHNATMFLIDRWFKHDAEIKAWLARADIIVIQRVLVEESRERCRFWKEKNKPIIVSFDDAYQLLKPEDGNQASKFWHGGAVDIRHPGGISYEKKLDIHPLKQVELSADYISGFSMPSKILAEDWQWLAPCYYIPNFIDSPRYLQAKANKVWKNTGDELVIGWGGSLSHLNSFKFSGILDGLSRVFKQRKNVKFLLAGDDRIKPLLKLPADRVVFQPYVMWNDWPRVMTKMDIVVAPLHSRYDHSRSAIKSCEAGLMGLPFVATGCPTYEDWQSRGIGLYVNDGPKEEMKDRATLWEQKLLDVIDHYTEHRDEMASHFEYAESWDVDRNVGYIEKVYKEIIDRNG